MAARRSPNARSAYHHGDLHRALVDAARALLHEGGPDACTLRAVARRAGVSHAAPYHHFRSREDLLGAVAAQGFLEMDRAMAEAQAAAPPHPTAQLVAVGMGYVLFARREPSLFRLMMRPEHIGPPAPGSPLDEAGPYARLLTALARLHGRPPPTECGPDVDAHLCWAAVHGIALLELDAGGTADRLAYARTLVGRLVQALSTLPAARGSVRRHGGRA